MSKPLEGFFLGIKSVIYGHIFIVCSEEQHNSTACNLGNVTLNETRLHPHMYIGIYSIRHKLLV